MHGFGIQGSVCITASQSLPIQPVLQIHEKSVPDEIQAPLTHGLVEHASVVSGTSHSAPFQPEVHVQVKPRAESGCEAHIPFSHGLLRHGSSSGSTETYK